MNVDDNEIQKFNAIAQEWWNPQGPCAPLHAINPLRLAFIQQYFTLKDSSVIDVGCGGGILSEALAKAGARVKGIDLSESAIEVAQQHAVNLEITYKVTSVESFAGQYPESAEAVTCMEMLEHVPDPASCIKACSQLLKPGGKLFVSTINRNLKSYLMAIIGAEWILKLIPKGTHDYAKFIRPSELSTWMRAASLEIKASQGIHYNPLSKKFKLESNDISVNYLIYAEKL